MSVTRTTEVGISNDRCDLIRGLNCCIVHLDQYAALPTHLHWCAYIADQNNRLTSILVAVTEKAQKEMTEPK